MGPADLAPLFPLELIKQEVSEDAGQEAQQRLAFPLLVDKLSGKKSKRHFIKNRIRGVKINLNRLK